MRLLFLTFAACVIVGCASSSPGPEKQQYLLRADVTLPDGPQQVPARVGIGRVVLADYLDQPGIVVLTEGNKVRAARQHYWAEPLQMGINLYMRDALTARTGYTVSADTARRLNWQYRLDIGIDRLHGTLDGQVRLVAGWSIINTAMDTEIAQYRFDRSTQQQEDGYDSLVAAEVSLLAQLADEIAASLDPVLAE
jgi:uncharacterized lipoprotein YmbA